MAERITIIGGGLAGLTLGIGLRQQDVPVTVWEAGNYPRHRVCGEFISGAGQESLRRMGLWEGLQKVGALPATTAAFYAGHAGGAARRLPTPAVCVSRFVLDQWLAWEFERIGGELRVGTRWAGGFGVGIVNASGRQAKPVVDGWRVFGLKVHARGVELAADLEMHLVPSGYVGLCRLAGGEVNICGLFRSATNTPGLSQHWRDRLGGPVGSVLHSRLEAAQYEEASFCSVAGLSLSPRCASERHGCCVGDALTMIPPVTGNGMSMAFESAELAIEPLAQFSKGERNWDMAAQAVASRCDGLFTRRLRWAAWLQWALFEPRARRAVLFLAAHSPWAWRQMFMRTR